MRREQNSLASLHAQGEQGAEGIRHGLCVSHASSSSTSQSTSRKSGYVDDDDIVVARKSSGKICHRLSSQSTALSIRTNWRRSRSAHAAPNHFSRLKPLPPMSRRRHGNWRRFKPASKNSITVAPWRTRMCRSGSNRGARSVSERRRGRDRRLVAVRSATSLTCVLILPVRPPIARPDPGSEASIGRRIGHDDGTSTAEPDQDAGQVRGRWFHHHEDGRPSEDAQRCY